MTNATEFPGADGLRRAQKTRRGNRGGLCCLNSKLRSDQSQMRVLRTITRPDGVTSRSRIVRQFV